MFKTGVIIAGSLSVGFISGVAATQTVVKKRINKVLPLVENACLNIITRATTEDLSPEEIKALGAEELKFLIIAMES